MINNNNFFIENLNSVVFLGQSDVFSELIKVNNSLNLDTLIVTSSHQSKLIDKKIDYKIFDTLDDKFKKFINKNIKVKNTIFVSLGARYIFKKNTIQNFFLNNLVNFHGTRLPLDSGGGGYSWKIMREDRIDNQLVHFVNEGIDTGLLLIIVCLYFQNLVKFQLIFKYSKKNFRFLYKFLTKLKMEKIYFKTSNQLFRRYNQD